MRIIKTFPLLAILILSGCSMPTAIVAPKQEQRAALMEEVKEGLPERMKYHDKTGFFYEFQYDRDNLYIKLATSDPDDIRKIVYFGFSVWIDMKGEKNQDQGFMFPRGARLSQLERPAGRSQGTAGDRQGTAGAAQGTAVRSRGDGLNLVLNRADEIDLIGIYGTETRTVKMRDSRIKVRAEIVDDILIYEAVIPFEMLEIGYNPLTAHSNMSIGLKTGHFEAPSRSDSQRPPQTRTGDGTGRRGPGQGQYPGQYPGRMPDRSIMESRSSEMGRLSKPTSLWIALEFDR